MLPLGLLPLKAAASPCLMHGSLLMAPAGTRRAGIALNDMTGQGENLRRTLLDHTKDQSGPASRYHGGQPDACGKLKSRRRGENIGTGKLIQAGPDAESMLPNKQAIED